MMFSLNILLLTIMALTDTINSRKIKAFFLNKNRPLREKECGPEECKLDCVFTRGEFAFPNKGSTTVCYRYNARTYAGFNYPYSMVMQFGNIKPDFSDLEDGFLFGNWPDNAESKEWKQSAWLAMSPPITNKWAASPLYVDGFDVHVWKHECFTIDFKSGSHKVFRNGEKVTENTYDTIKNMEGLTDTADFACLGCAFRSTGSKIMSVVARVTDLQIFSKELPEKEILEITSCKKFVKGDILDWDKEKWVIKGDKLYTVVEEWDLEKEICADQNNSLLYLPYMMNKRPVGEQECKKFSSLLYPYSTKEEYDRIAYFLSNSNHYKNSECVRDVKDTDDKYTLQSMVDVELMADGSYQSPNTGKTMLYAPWQSGRPWAGNVNCVIVHLKLKKTKTRLAETYKEEIVDEKCLDVDKGCPTCINPLPSTRLYVRGLCKESSLDRNYIFRIGENGNPIYVGLHLSFIYYDTKRKLWAWIDKSKPNSTVTTLAKEKSMMIGINEMDFSDYDDKCVELLKEKVLRIKLTTCNEGFFTCDDGQCIDIETRCDQTPNCKDQSDENNCNMLIVKDNYKKKISPFKFDQIIGVIPANINVSLEIFSLLKFIEVDLQYVLKYKIRMEWYDYRLTYWNLKKRRSANAFSQDDTNKLWMPSLVFQNTENNEVTIADSEAEVTVTREGDFSRSDDTVVEEINIFSGEDNRITFERVYTKTFRCEYQLQLYPFDTQRCYVEIVVKNLDKFGVEITPNTITMLGETVLTQYIVNAWTLGYKNETDPSEGIIMTVVLKRRILNELLTTYLPSLLILTIVYATNFFKDFFFEAVVTVNLTSQLVLTTLFISVSGALPKTAYVKMIDIWLIFAQLIPFFEVLLHTFLDAMRTGGDDGEREVNHHGKIITVGGDGSEKDLDDTAMYGKLNQDLENKYLGKISQGQFGSNLSLIKNKQKIGDQAMVDVEQKTMKVTHNQLIARDEEKEVDARKQFYENAAVRNERIVKIGVWISLKGIPILIGTFSAFYWGYGLSNYFDSDVQMKAGI